MMRPYISRNGANKTATMFSFFPCGSLVSQLTKSVNDDTKNQVQEQDQYHNEKSQVEHDPVNIVLIVLH
jgi:hypothetical protein